MRIVFWQNIISPHQLAYINELPRYAEVTLVVEQEMLEERRVQGWSTPWVHPDIRVIVAPEDATLRDLIQSDREAINVFSGINAYPMVWRVFQEAQRQKCRTFVLAEPYEWSGFKGYLRRLMYRYLFWRYSHGIDALLTTGDRGVEGYLRSGMSEAKLYQWAYFTGSGRPSTSSWADQVPCPSSINLEDKPLAPWLIREGQGEESPRERVAELVRLLFVGQLDVNKNVMGLLDALDRQVHAAWSLKIIGGGILREVLEARVAQSERISYLGSLPNSQVLEEMQTSDVLVLPSLYDGWGAVVNEALEQGMRVLASDRCGASILLSEPWRGESIKLEGDGLARALSRLIAQGRHSESTRERIRLWARAHISGAVGADYFMRIVNHVYGGEEDA